MATPSTFDFSTGVSVLADPDTADVPAAPHRVLIRRMGQPMATDVSVQVAAGAGQIVAAEAAADACMTWFDEVDRHLSRFRPDSELSRLNATAGRWFSASEMLFEMVSLAVASAAASGGLFDPTLLRQLEALGYDRDFALIAHDAVPRHAPPPPAVAAPQAWRAIALDPARRRVKLPPGAALDLGGIAKGWAADEALGHFCAAFPGALINVGGDLRLRGGPQPGTAWSVSIRDPRAEAAAGGSSASPGPMGADGRTHQHHEARVAVVTFSRGALATSGALRRWWLRDGVRQHHVLDPRTGLPVPLWIDEHDSRTLAPSDGQPLIATATALAPTAARAEVAAKMALLRGYPAALYAVETAWERYGAVGPETDGDVGVALVLTFGTGEVVQSRNVAAYLGSWGTDGAPLPMAVPTTFAMARNGV